MDHENFSSVKRKVWRKKSQELKFDRSLDFSAFAPSAVPDDLFRREGDSFVAFSSGWAALLELTIIGPIPRWKPDAHSVCTRSMSSFFFSEFPISVSGLGTMQKPPYNLAECSWILWGPGQLLSFVYAFVEVDVPRYDV
jgi:hypothetical protein